MLDPGLLNRLFEPCLECSRSRMLKTETVVLPARGVIPSSHYPAESCIRRHLTCCEAHGQIPIVGHIPRKIRVDNLTCRRLQLCKPMRRKLHGRVTTEFLRMCARMNKIEGFHHCDINLADTLF